MLSKMLTRMTEKSSTANFTNPFTEGRSAGDLGGILGKVILFANSMSLDAPLVGIIWLGCFSSIYSISIEFHHYIALFCVAWLAYAGDRILDSLRFHSVSHKLPRHQFATIYFKPLVCVWASVAIFSMLYIFSTLTMTEIICGFSLLGLLAIYFMGCFYFPGLLRGVVPRELIVGVFFSLAAHFFVLIQLSHWGFYTIWTFLCFLILCSLNCLSISRWEYFSDEQSGETSFFTRNPERLHRFRYALIWFIYLLFIVCLIAISMYQMPRFELSVLMSAILLLMLDRSLINLHLKPVLADFSLFAPCLILSVTS